MEDVSIISREERSRGGMEKKSCPGRVSNEEHIGSPGIDPLTWHSSSSSSAGADCSKAQKCPKRLSLGRTRRFELCFWLVQ